MLKTGLVVFLERWSVDFDALGFDDGADLRGAILLAKNGISNNVRTYALLELGEIGWAERIRLGYDRNEIDTGGEALHDLNVQWFESVAGRTDEVQASMHSQVNLLRSAWLLLLQHVALMLVVQELDDWLPAVSVVYVVTKAWSIDDRQSDFEELLF